MQGTGLFIEMFPVWRANMKTISCKCFWLLLLMLLLPTGLLAAETVESPAPPALPGVAEVIPRLAELRQEAGTVQNRLGILSETKSFEDPLESVKKRREKLAEEVAQFESGTGWSFDRLLEGRQHLEEHKNNLDDLLNSISLRLAELDGLRQDWLEKRTFWDQWRKAQGAGLLRAQKEAFDKAPRDIAGILDRITVAGKPLVALQNEVIQLEEQNQLSLVQIDEMLQAMRGKTFKKNAKSFTNPDFYRQFNRSLLAEAGKGLRQTSGFEKYFFRQKGWIVALQLLLAAGLAIFIMAQRNKVQITEEWRFIFQHPAATGVFVAVTALSPLYGVTPGSLRLLLIALAAFSSAILVSGLLRSPCKIFMVYLLATLLVVSTALQVIALPAPLYRLYLTFLSLTGFPLLVLLASRIRKNLGGRTEGFVLALRLGAVVLFLAFLAQFGGFTNLSSRLFESSIQTVFLGLFAAMAIRLGRGGLDYLFGLRFFRRRLFFSSFGDELVAQLKKVFQVFILVSSMLYLVVIWGWGIFDSPREVWAAFMQLGFSLGEVRVTAHMVVIALLALYAAVQISWLLRALLDTEFFPRSAIERGVRDSIKKLLHYSMMLIGFLFAMSLLGVTLRNFVVLAGAFGIGIGFGLQNIVNNFVSGLVLLFERPIKLGDMVMIEGEWAIVKKIGLRSTTVETFDLSEIIVPNSDLISQKVTNWTLSNEQSRLVIPVGVAYGSDVSKVLTILQECAEQHPKVLETPAPSVIFTAFGASSLDFELRAWIADVNSRLAVKSELLLEIDARFRRANVEIPFPQHDLHLRSIDSAVLDRVSTGKKPLVPDPPDGRSGRHPQVPDETGN
jgi:potassium efflux system protein